MYNTLTTCMHIFHVFYDAQLSPKVDEISYTGLCLTSLTIYRTLIARLTNYLGHLNSTSRLLEVP